MSDEEIQAVVQIYGTDMNEVKYLDFINDANPFRHTQGEEGFAEAKKTTYVGKQQAFKGEGDFEKLIFKLKAQIKKDRIRLAEFFQDHDLLRKGTITQQKFRGVLYAQKIYLTNEEFEILEKQFSVPNDATKVNYLLFNSCIEEIFTVKDLEKNPLKKTIEFHAPSILDPKQQLSEEEEAVLEECMRRLGWFVRNKRLLIKPFF